MTRFSIGIALVLAACGSPELAGPRAETGSPAVAWTIEDLGATPPSEGSTVLLTDAVVVSPSATLDGRVWLQGASVDAWVLVRRGGPSTDWPPPAGTVVELAGRWNLNALWVLSQSDWRSVDFRTPLVGARDPDGVGQLQAWPEENVLGPPDAWGYNRLYSGRQVSDGLGVTLPGPGTVDLWGIVVEPGVLAPRSAEDVRGEVRPVAATPTTLDAVVAGLHRSGELVRVEATVTSPRAPDGAQAIQDGPAGVWLQTFGTERAGFMGERVVLELLLDDAQTAQCRRVEQSLGTAKRTLVTDGLPHGAYVRVTVEGLEERLPTGEWRLAGGAMLDDRFVDLTEVREGDLVFGVVDTRTGETRVAVTEWVSAG
ncbi:MAG: hypothetical protein ACON5B_09710 [Myxococcota bacterium]